MIEEPVLNNVCNFEFLSESIVKANDSEIPKVNKLVQKSAFAINDLLSLFRKRNECRDSKKTR